MLSEKTADDEQAQQLSESDCATNPARPGAGLAAGYQVVRQADTAQTSSNWA
jgi:hypothetical protein